jgi:hypothetical protein
VRAFPGPGGKWQITQDGGTMPVWNPDGKELFYIGVDGLMSVPVETEGDFRHGAPVLLFESKGGSYGAGNAYAYDVAPDGKRFLMFTALESEVEAPGTVTLLQGWRSLLSE